MPRILLCLLAVVSLAPAARADDTDPEPPYRGKRHDSPKAVFDAYAAANGKKDFRAAFACFTPEAQKDQAAFTAHMMLVVKRRNFPEEFRATCKPLFGVMEKHGLGEQAVKDIEVADTHLTIPDKARLALRGLIKKPDLFLVDFCKAQIQARKLGFGAASGKVTSKLADLEVKEDRAIGVIVTTSERTELRQKVEFVKTPAGWKMIPALRHDATRTGPAAKEPAK